MAGTNLLEVKNLITEFNTDAGKVRVIDDVSLHLKKGETLGIVGESGSGKSVTSLSVMRLLPKPAGEINGGEVILGGENLLDLSPDDMHSIRGNKIAMIFQEPMTALNPVHKVGQQLGESFRLHFPKMKPDEIRTESVKLLTQVGIPLPEKRLDEYPHQLSGGIRQRVMIAIALACKPEILIADEPTTALDVTIQAQILDLMKGLQKELGMAIVFITHDLGVIAELCDRVIVMYAGKVVEEGSVRDIFKNPKHPYTKGLLESIPRLDHPSKTHLQTIEGMVPSFFDLPKGCRFQNRCPYVFDKCKEELPELFNLGSDRSSRCFKHSEL